MTYCKTLNFREPLILTNFAISAKFSSFSSANISRVCRGEFQPLYFAKFNGRKYEPAAHVRVYGGCENEGLYSKQNALHLIHQRACSDQLIEGRINLTPLNKFRESVWQSSTLIYHEPVAKWYICFVYVDRSITINAHRSYSSALLRAVRFLLPVS